MSGAARLDQWLAYAERGWPVFPCNGKEPLTDHGFYDASTDSSVIEAWWHRWPDASIAIRTGSESGLLVLDVDGDDGTESLRRLERDHDELPRTASVKTPSGGSHFYLGHPGGEIRGSVRKLGPGLDVRADGGYVVAPPSPGYEPDEEAPVAKAPEWLVKMMRDASRNGAAPKVGDVIPEHKRNDTLASLAGTMRRRGMDESAIAAALKVTNAERCKPPLSEAEVERIAGSISRYAPADQESAAGEAEGKGSRNRATVQLPKLASERSILDRFAVDVRKAGLAGEERAAKLVYLVLTSRLLDRPISAAIKAPSAAGKSYLVDTVLRFFPGSAYYTVTGMSERALVYSEEPLVHRTLVIYEAAGMAGDGFAPYFLRTLLSEGHIRYETVETPKKGKPTGVVLEREGPTGAILTTTRVKLDSELETRLLSIPVTDSAQQTKAVMYALADEDNVEPEIGAEWLQLQQAIAGQTVTIPFAHELAEAIPPAATRLRRDFGAILGLIRAHALLHVATRERDGEGRTVATIEDYAVVRELVADLISEGVGRTVSPETRETVQAVEALAPDHEDGVRQVALAAELDLDRGTVSRRVRKALDGGYLRNLEEKRGRPHRLLPGDPLPEEQLILPEPEELHGCTVAETPPGERR